jgi:MinD-like ATPase involved in chromosome partitioning or flagellar assembly
MADGVVALALIGGDERLERELAELVAQLGDVALLPEASADRADALLIADGQRGAALDRLRAELGTRPSRRIMLIGAPGTIDLAEAMASGARGVLESPLGAGRLRASLAAAGCLDVSPSRALDSGGGPIVVIGASGGCGATTCAAALAAATPRAVLVDLDLASGDAAAVAGAAIGTGDALLALAYAAGIGSRELHANLADGPSTRVLPAPALPEHADLVDEGGVSRVLDAIRRADMQAVVDAGSRVGVETLPALERASAIMIVSPTGANGRRGVVRVASLLFRLGVADRPIGIVASRVWPHRRSHASELAKASGLPLWAIVNERPSVAHAAQAGEPPPVAPFASLAIALAEVIEP